MTYILNLNACFVMDTNFQEILTGESKWEKKGRIGENHDWKGNTEQVGHDKCS